MTKFLSIVLLFTLCIALPEARAQSTGVRETKAGLSLRDPLSREELIRHAYKHNPRLRAARQKWAAVLARYPQVTAYKDPFLQYTYFIEEVQTRVGPQKHRLSLAQEIPFPGKLTLAGEIAAEEIKIARREFERQARDLIVELKEAYAELAYIERALALTEQNRELARHLARLGSTEYSQDGTTLNDVFQAQAQLSQLTYDLVLLKELKSSQTTRINSLLDRPPETPLGHARPTAYRPFPYSLEDLYRLALENRQELDISQRDIARRSKRIEMARLEYWPNFRLGVDYTAVGRAAAVADSGQDAYGISIGLTIPLWFDKNRGRIREAESEYEAALSRKKELENKTLSEIKSIYFQLQNSARLVRLYRESLIPQAAQSMETAESWFKSGQGSFSGLLETQSVWLNFNLALERALADYHQRVARLEKAAGVGLPLERPTETKRGGAK